LIESLIGIFALDDNYNIINKELFLIDINYIAESLIKQSKGEITREVARIVDFLLKNGYKSFVMTNSQLAESLRSKYKMSIVIEEASNAEIKLKDKVPIFAFENNFIDNIDEFIGFNNEISTQISKITIQTTLSSKESLITQTVQLLGELETILNGFDVRVREWYGLHFPELSRIIKEHELFEKFVIEIGDKANITEINLKKLNFEKKEQNQIIKAQNRSIGATLEEIDINEIKKLAANALQLHEFRTNLTAYISNLATSTAPNISELAGPILAAKLIEKAGSLRRLALMPASSIQILGAEKALYRAVKTKSKPPKHGLIFQHQYVNGAPKKMRGIRARHLAAKIAFAARADAITGNNIAAQLKKELEEAATWSE
jgi:nucleolar protein 56